MAKLEGHSRGTRSSSLLNAFSSSEIADAEPDEVDTGAVAIRQLRVSELRLKQPLRLVGVGDRAKDATVVEVVSFVQ